MRLSITGRREPIRQIRYASGQVAETSLRSLEGTEPWMLGLSPAFVIYRRLGQSQYIPSPPS